MPKVLDVLERSALPTIESTLTKIGVQPARYNRSKCPIHSGDNPIAFSFDDERGIWHCFRCGTGVGATTFMAKDLRTDFEGVLSFLSMQTGNRPPKLNREAVG